MRACVPQTNNIRSENEKPGVYLVGAPFLETDDPSRIERTTDLLNQIPAVVYVYDIVRKESVFANRTARDLFGLADKPQDPTRSFPVSLMHPEDIPKFWKHLEKISRSEGTEYFECEYRLKDSGGNWRWFSGRDKGFGKADDGRVGKILNFANDITERKLLEDTLKNAMETRTSSILAGGIAHDLNNLVSAMTGHAELARMENTKNGVDCDSIDEILKAAGLAQSLLRQITTLSKRRPWPEHGEYQVEAKSVVRQTLNLLKSVLPSGVEIRESLKSDGRVALEPLKLHRIAMNLFRNAIQSIDGETGLVEVEFADFVPDDSFFEKHRGLPKKNYMKLTVRDSGRGIPEEIADCIFDPYFTTKTCGENAGLGLSVVRDIVESGGGVVEAESRPGEGARFDVYLPAA